jgi:GNAT superfamily N-acetyltransferase
VPDGDVVDPAVRGTGPAGALVDAVLAWSRRHGATSVRLHVVEQNSRARRLYERHGFRPRGRVTRDGRVEIEMERELARDHP